MIVIPWQIVPFPDRVRRGGAVGVRVLLADPGSPGSVSGRGSTLDGHSYVESPREKPGISAAELKDSRAHCMKYDLTMDQIALDAIKSRFAELT